MSANRLGLLSRALFRRLFKSPACLHFPKNAFALHLLFQYAKSLFDIVVSDENLQNYSFLPADAAGLLVALNGQGYFATLMLDGLNHGSTTPEADFPRLEDSSGTFRPSISDSTILRSNFSSS
jgi:hypothetical protein